MGNVDQAEGLRRLMSFARARTVAFVGGKRGAGATRFVINFARALARKGRRVLVVDENFASQNIAESFGMRACFDLKHVIGGDCSLEQALLRGPDDIVVLPAARAARTLPRLDTASAERAIRCFAELDRRADIVLLDARNDAQAPSPFASAVQEVIVIVSPGPSSITGGYAAVKRMSRGNGRRRFHIMVNRSQHGDTSERVFRNMSEAAARHLQVDLDYMGAIPLDPEGDSGAALRSAKLIETARLFSEHAGAMLRWTSPQEAASRLDTFMQRAIYESRLIAAGTGA